MPDGLSGSWSGTFLMAPRLRRRFEEVTGLARQTFYEALDYRQGALVDCGRGANGVPYSLNLNGSWREALDRNFSEWRKPGVFRRKQQLENRYLALFSEAIAHVDQGRSKKD